MECGAGEWDFYEAEIIEKNDRTILGARVKRNEWRELWEKCMVKKQIPFAFWLLSSASVRVRWLLRRQWWNLHGSIFTNLDNPSYNSERNGETAKPWASQFSDGRRKTCPLAHLIRVSQGNQMIFQAWNCSQQGWIKANECIKSESKGKPRRNCGFSARSLTKFRATNHVSGKMCISNQRIPKIGDYHGNPWKKTLRKELFIDTCKSARLRYSKTKLFCLRKCETERGRSFSSLADTCSLPLPWNFPTLLRAKLSKRSLIYLPKTAIQLLPLTLRTVLWPFPAPWFVKI